MRKGPLFPTERPLDSDNPNGCRHRLRDNRSTGTPRPVGAGRARDGRSPGLRVLATGPAFPVSQWPRIGPALAAYICGGRHGLGPAPSGLLRHVFTLLPGPPGGPPTTDTPA